MRRILICGLVFAVLCGARPASTQDGEPRMPTRTLERALEEARTVGCDRSAALSRALQETAGRAAGARADGLLLLAAQADPTRAEPRLAAARRALGRGDVGGAVSALQGAFRAARLDAVQEARWLERLMRGGHTWLVATFTTLVVLGALRGARLARHALGRQIGSQTAALLGLLVPLAILAHVSLAVGTLALAVVTAPYVRRGERRLLAVLCLGLAAFEWALPAAAPHAVLLDPRTRTSQLSRLAAGAHDPEAERALVSRPERSGAEELVLGLRARRTGDLTAARGHFEACLARDKSSAAAFVDLANIYFQLGQYERAIVGYRSASALRPDDPVPHYDLAQAYIRTLHYGESDTALRAAAQRGMAAADRRGSIWRTDSSPVVDLGVSKAEVMQMARAEAASAPARARLRLQAWKQASWAALRPGLAPWLLAATALLLFAVPRRSRAVLPCAECGTILCAHCARQEPALDLCDGCAAAHGRSEPRASGDGSARPVVPPRRMSLRSGRWVGPLFPGAGALVRGSILAAFCGVAAAWAALLALLGVLNAARARSSAWYTEADVRALQCITVAFLLLWLVGLWRQRPRDLGAPLRAPARPARAGA